MIYPLKNTIMHYDWGTRDGKAFIPRFLGQTAEPGKPYAELWIGAHPKSPSLALTSSGWQPLDRIIASDPARMLGAASVRRFGPGLPFLLKILSAGQALSIQTHPGKADAERLHAIDPAHYPDDNHKPEIAIALDRLEALAGFRPAQEIAEWMTRLPELRSFAGSAVIEQLIRHPGNETVFELYSLLMKQSGDFGKLDLLIQALVNRFRALPDPAPEQVQFLRQHALYGTDIGLLSFFFFNLLALQPGEAIFTGAGIPHAYLEGTIIECMANSDNVVRAGLTPKFKDVDTLLDILITDCNPFPVTNGTPTGPDRVYRPPVPEFEIIRCHDSSGATRVVESEDLARILLVLSGELTAEADGQSVTLKQGESCFIPAATGTYTLRTRLKTDWIVTQAQLTEE